MTPQVLLFDVFFEKGTHLNAAEIVKKNMIDLDFLEYSCN